MVAKVWANMTLISFTNFARCYLLKKRYCFLFVCECRFRLVFHIHSISLSFHFYNKERNNSKKLIYLCIQLGEPYHK